MKRWFDAHCLPWSDAIAKTLDDQGVEFVEDLKILNRAVFSHFFMDKKPIVKTRSEIAFLMGIEDTTFWNCDFSRPPNSFHAISDLVLTIGFFVHEKMREDIPVQYLQILHKSNTLVIERLCNRVGPREAMRIKPSLHVGVCLIIGRHKIGVIRNTE